MLTFLTATEGNERLEALVHYPVNGSQTVQTIPGRVGRKAIFLSFLLLVKSFNKPVPRSVVGIRDQSNCGFFFLLSLV